MSPSPEELEEVLLNCRYGELDELKTFIDTHGVDAFVEAKDERGTTGLHYVCGNGHLELADYLIPLLPSSSFSSQNSSGSTPLHWAALNSHLPLAQALVLSPSSPGDSLIDIKNSVGFTPVGEAEMADAKEVAMWLVGRMILNDKKSDPTGASDETPAVEGAEKAGAEEDDGEEEVPLFKLTLDEKGEVIKHESLIGEQQQGSIE